MDQRTKEVGSRLKGLVRVFTVSMAISTKEIGKMT